MTNTTPHFLYAEIVNSIRGTKSYLSAISNPADGTIGFAEDTGELGIYSTSLGQWTWLGSSTGTSSSFLSRSWIGV